MTCAEKIREHRHGAKLTVSQLAAKAGMNAQYLAELERMNGEQPVIDLMRLSRALGIHTIDLFRDEQVKKDTCSRPGMRSRRL